MLSRFFLQVFRCLNIRQAIFFLVFSLSGAWLILPALQAQAATLIFSPSSGSYKVGQTFSVGVLLSSPDESANAASGVLSYSKDTLEALGISKGSSVSLWVQEPSLSKPNGTASFEGIILNPGYKGRGASLVTLQFKAKAAGTGTLRFSSGSILANDGEGTSILNGLGGASFQIGGSAPPSEPTTPSVVSVGPSVVNLTSPTHPDQSKWYALDQAVLVWNPTPGITGVNAVFDHASGTVPDKVSGGIFSAQTYSKIADGSWYAHVRLQNKSGWGPAAQYRIQVDTTRPDLTVTESPRPVTNGNVSFVVHATDTHSGLARIEYQLDQAPLQAWQDDGGHVLELRGVSVGDHTLAVHAFDRAGNLAAISVGFSVVAVAPPVFTEYPPVSYQGEIFIARGAAEPRATVVVSLRHEQEDPVVQSVSTGADGAFSFISRDRLKLGLYTLSAQSVNAQGVKSVSSRELVIMAQPPVLSRLEYYAVIALACMVPLLVFLLLLVLLFWYRSHTCLVCRTPYAGHEEKKLAEVETLKTQIRRQIERLEKKIAEEETLTHHEKETLTRLRASLNALGG